LAQAGQWGRMQGLATSVSEPLSAGQSAASSARNWLWSAASKRVRVGIRVCMPSYIHTMQAKKKRSHTRNENRGCLRHYASAGFFLKAVFVFCLFSFPGGSGFSKRYPGLRVAGRSRCSSYYPCMLRIRKQHTVTFAVLARKRARPIYQTGRCQPKGAPGARRFKLSACLHQVLSVWVRGFGRVAH
jgi:hypothetical protein